MPNESNFVSLLRQIRAGYSDRPRMYLQAMFLCGVRT